MSLGPDGPVAFVLMVKNWSAKQLRRGRHNRQCHKQWSWNCIIQSEMPGSEWLTHFIISKSALGKWIFAFNNSESPRTRHRAQSPWPEHSNVINSERPAEIYEKIIYCLKKNSISPWTWAWMIWFKQTLSPMLILLLRICIAGHVIHF